MSHIQILRVYESFNAMSCNSKFIASKHVDNKDKYPSEVSFQFYLNYDVTVTSSVHLRFWNIVAVSSRQEVLWLASWRLVLNSLNKVFKNKTFCLWKRFPFETFSTNELIRSRHFTENFDFYSRIFLKISSKSKMVYNCISSLWIGF